MSKNPRPSPPSLSDSPLPGDSQPNLARIAQLAGEESAITRLETLLQQAFQGLPEPIRLAEELFQFVRGVVGDHDVLAMFEQNEKSLDALLRLFSISPSLSKRLIANPEMFIALQLGDGSHQPSKLQLLDCLSDSIAGVDQVRNAGPIIHAFYDRELIRIAYADYVDGLAPDKVGQLLAQLADTVIQSALKWTLQSLVNQRGEPQRSDGTCPKITVIGLGNLGGEDLAYGAAWPLIVLFDAIDYRNTWHRDFYETLLREMIELLCGDGKSESFINIDRRPGPRSEVGVYICSVREAARIYETSGRPWQRLLFVRARVVAGSMSVGQQFLHRIKPWIYRRYTGNAEHAEVQAIRQKLIRRCHESSIQDVIEKQTPTDIHQIAGGRRDLEFAVEFLQILHGAHLPDVRQTRFLDAVGALRHQECITENERILLSEHYARLVKLENLLAISANGRTVLPTGDLQRQRLAWSLGIADETKPSGDLTRFYQLLRDTYTKNQQTLAELMSADRFDSVTQEEPPIETELVLDPDPDTGDVARMMQKHGVSDPALAMDHLISLCNETIPFLSPHRCRYAFASLAPKLLHEVSQTPDPDTTLAMLVEVTDSLGAKAMLWDLLRSHAPTLKLMVRLCASTPYLARILINHPGMIDELMDSLRRNHLPPDGKIDAYSIELCRRAVDLDAVLLGFKNSLELTVGVRDILGKEEIDATQAAIASTAESCIRRVVEQEHEDLAAKFGDPTDRDGKPSQLIALAFGKLGGREPNYHSNLEVAFFYSSGGETKRRVGGRYATSSNHDFYHKVVQQTVGRINRIGPNGQLYKIGSPLDSPYRGSLVRSVDEFFSSFHDQSAPLHHRLMLCKARVISGNRLRNIEIQKQINEAISSGVWTSEMGEEIRNMRLKLETTASSENFKRGSGGTLDAQWIAQTLTLKHAGEAPSIICPGTVESLNRLAETGFLEEEDANTLVDGYQTLRHIEALLCLMSFSSRHELPYLKEEQENLAFLVGDATPSSIQQQSAQIRSKNRQVFERIFHQLKYS